MRLAIIRRPFPSDFAKFSVLKCMSMSCILVEKDFTL